MRHHCPLSTGPLMASPAERGKDPQENAQGPGDPHTQSQECYYRPCPPNPQIIRAAWRCRDNSVMLGDQLVGEVSTMVAPPYPGSGKGTESSQVNAHWSLGEVCLPTNSRISGAPSVANSTVESQEPTVGPVARIHSELPVGGSGRWAGGRSVLAKVLRGRGVPRGPWRTLGCFLISI